MYTIIEVNFLKIIRNDYFQKVLNKDRDSIFEEIAYLGFSEQEVGVLRQCMKIKV